VVLVDSGVLIDVLSEDEPFNEVSSAVLASIADRHELAINPIIFAELAARAPSLEAVERALPPTSYLREELPYRAAFLAGRAFAAYRRAGGTRRSPMPDFYIGAHAAVLKCAIVTRDTARYRRYFSTVPLIVPG